MNPFEKIDFSLFKTKQLITATAATEVALLLLNSPEIKAASTHILSVVN